MTTKDTLICSAADLPYLERVRYFPRQLITPDDLTQEQEYFRHKLRRHNRLLHGWGIVCGAWVKEGQGDCEVIIEPGYILGPYGDEIVIDRDVPVNLCREGLDGNAVSPCGEVLDPWCCDVRVERPTGQRLYLAVRYAECQTRPVRVHPVGCGCDETECQYSRVRDSFAIKVLVSLPETYSDPMPQHNPAESFLCLKSTEGRICPPCPTEPWVILADVTLTADGRVGTINCFDHRRYVVSFAEYYFLCQPQTEPPDNQIVIGRDMARRLGVPGLIDLRTGFTTTRPTTTVALQRLDGTLVPLPVRFTIEPDEAYADLLAREGDREFYDPASDETYTLRELYALAEVDPRATISGIAEALRPLEGLRLNVADLRVVRAGMAGLLDNEGIERLDRDHAGVPTAATELPATHLRGISPSSRLGENLRDRTIADIAGMTRETFIDMALQGVPARQRRAGERQASEVWAYATRVANLRRAWRGE